MKDICCAHYGPLWTKRAVSSRRSRDGLDGGDGIRDAAGPEAGPKGVDFGFELGIGEHGEVRQLLLAMICNARP